MKTTIQQLLLVALLACSAMVKAQGVTVPFYNNLWCDVKIGYEEWHMDPVLGCQAGVPGCPNFGAGVVTISSGGVYNHTTCLSPIVDLCVWVIEIGGVAVNAGGCPNHCSMQNCHITCTGQTGSCGGSSCFSSGWIINYGITPTGGSWSIN